MKQSGVVLFGASFMLQHPEGALHAAAPTREPLLPQRASKLGLAALRLEQRGSWCPTPPDSSH